MTQSKVYLILGSDNFWYSTCSSLDEAKQDLKYIKGEFKKNGYFSTQNEMPYDFYIYEATKRSIKK